MLGSRGRSKNAAAAELPPSDVRSREEAGNLLSFQIGRVARLLRQRFDIGAKRLGFTRAQWHAIKVIRHNEGSSQRCIAEILEMGEVTAGRLIAKLEADGWVQRCPDQNDGRVSRVYLASGAATVLGALDTISAEEGRRALQGFSPQDIARLSRYLDMIARNLARPPEACAEGAKPVPEA